VTVQKEIGFTPATITNKIPLKGGLYLTNEFRKAQYPMRAKQMVFGVASVGDALTNNTEKLISDIFQETMTLDRTEITSAPLSQKCDVVITPEVVRLHFEVESTIPARAIIQTIIKWNIVSPEGKEIYSTTIKSDDITVSRPRGKEERSIVQSLRDNFEKAREDIYGSGWWKKQWWKKEGHDK
jgi:hypothetical protein